MKKQVLSFIIAAALLAACTKDANVDSVKNQTGGNAGSITRFTAFNNYLYALDQNKVKVYDITDANMPKLVNELTTDYGLETITLYEGTIYIGSRSSLYILDVSVPANPVILSQTVREGALAGGCDPVVVKNTYAFSTVKIIENVCGQINSSSRLLVYDVSDKINPVLVDEEVMTMPNGLAYEDNYLFVCDEGDDRIFIYDISTPTAIHPYSSFDLVDPVDVIITDTKMVVSTKTGFSFFDVNNIDNIQSKGNIEIH